MARATLFVFLNLQVKYLTIQWMGILSGARASKFTQSDSFGFENWWRVLFNENAPGDTYMQERNVTRDF